MENLCCQPLAFANVLRRVAAGLFVGAAPRVPVFHETAASPSAGSARSRRLRAATVLDFAPFATWFSRCSPRVSPANASGFQEGSWREFPAVCPTAVQTKTGHCRMNDSRLAGREWKRVTRAFGYASPGGTSAVTSSCKRYFPRSIRQ